MPSTLPAYADHLLPSTSTPLEKIFGATAEARIAGIPSPIHLLNDATSAPSAFLSALAFEVGVDLWDENWTDVKKRAVIQKQISLKKILCTIGGIRAYIGIEGGKLIDYVVPPQTPFASKALSDADYEAWLGQLPQLRIYYGNERSSVATGQSFVGQSFIGLGATLTLDSGRDLLGRHAYYFDPSTGLESRITLQDLGIDPTASEATIEEQVYVPGSASTYEAYPDRFIGNVFLAPPLKEPTTVTYSLAQPGTGDVDIGSVVLALGASFDAVSANYDKIPVTGTAIAGEAFIGASFIGHGFGFIDDSEIDFYDRMFLADPSIPTPSTVGTTYIGHSRLQMQPFRAELLIDAQESAAPSLAIEGRFVGNCFATAQDNTKRNAILNAIELAKAGRDRVYVDFQVTEILSFADAPTLDGSMGFGQRVPRTGL